MKQYKELAGQTIIYGLGTIIPRVLNFLLTPLYTYVFVTQDFGIITEMYSYIAFFMVLLTFGMETTFFRFSSQAKEPQTLFNNSFFIVLITSFIFLVFALAFKNNIASIIGYKDYSIYIEYIALIVFFDAIVSIPLSKLRLEGKAVFFSLIRLGNITINIFLNIFFFVICRNSENVFLHSLYNENIGVGYVFISNLVASFFNFLILLPSILRFRFAIEFAFLKKMLIFTLPLVFVGLAAMINEVGDKLFLKYLVIPKDEALSSVGIYGANYKLALLMTIFIQVYKFAAEPFFFKHANNLQAKELYSTIMTWFVIFCLAIFLLVTMNISIFKFFIDEDYRVGLFIVPIILLANMFLGIYYNLSIWYKLSNLTYLGAFVSLIGVIITILMNFWLIPIIGYLGSAIATFVCYFSMMVLSYFLGQKHYKVVYDLKRLFFYFTLAMCLFIVRYFINISGILSDLIISNLLLLVFIAVVIYYQKIQLSNVLRFIKKR